MQRLAAEAAPAPPSASRFEPAGKRLLRCLFRLMARLPDTVVARFAGGEASTSEVAAADPRTRLHARLVGRFGSGPITDLVSARRSSVFSLGLLEGDPLPMKRIENIVLDGEGGPLKARLYVPQGVRQGDPALIFLHFGGCVLGNLETSHTACTYLAAHGRMNVLSLDYRLAPEHRFPAALDDTLSAYRWLKSHAAALGVDPLRIGLGGDSAGGYLAAAACLALRERGEPLPFLQLLMYPVIEMDRAGLPASPFDHAYPLTRQDMEWFAVQYMRTAADAADPLCSVGRTERLAGLPPAILVQAGHDVLFHEGESFASRLESEGVLLRRLVYPTLPHAFSAMSGGVPAARSALIEIARAAGAAFSRPTPHPHGDLP